MWVSALNKGALLGLFLCLLFASSFCYAEDRAQEVEVVGVAECADCKQGNIKTSQAYAGLPVTIDCKVKNGDFVRRGVGELDEDGKFKVSIPKEILQDGKLNEECYVQLHNAAATPCPVKKGIESSKIVFKSKTDEKHTFEPNGNIKFSTALCTSAFLWPFYKYPPLPKLPPLSEWKKHFLPPFKHHPWLKPHPWHKPHPLLKPVPPVYKKKPPVYKPPVPVSKPKPKPCPPVPVSKPKPKPNPPVVKPLPPPVPIYKPKPKPKPQPPIYKPKPPVFKKPLPPPVPIYKPKPPVFKKPLPPPVPIYKPKPPVFNKPLPPPVPIYKPKPPIFYKPLPPPVPIYKPMPPIYKKPCPPIPKLPPWPKLPPKHFDHPKIGHFLPHPPLSPHP